MRRLPLLIYLQSCCLLTHSLGPAALRFVVLADWGGLPVPPYYTPHQEAVAAELDRLTQMEGLDLVLSLGDHFYFNGVKNVEDPRFKVVGWLTFERVFSQPDLLLIPWFLVGGNHDHRGNISAQMFYSNTSQRWNYPALYYELSLIVPHTNVSLTVLMIDTVILCGNSLDQNQPDSPDDPRAAEHQWDWIRSRLTHSRSDYLLVAGHYPVWSVGHHGPTSCLVKRLRPLLKKFRVSAYLSGHDHNLQFIREDDGSSYVVSGSGMVSDPAFSHRGSVPESWQLYSSPVNHTVGGVAYIQVTERHMTVRFLQTDGKSDDSDGDDDGDQQQDEDDGSSNGAHRVSGALGVAHLSQLLAETATGNEGLDIEAVAVPLIQPLHLDHVGLEIFGFLRMTERWSNGGGALEVNGRSFVRGETHLAGARAPAVGDSVLQLVGENVPYTELAAIFKEGVTGLNQQEAALTPEPGVARGPTVFVGAEARRGGVWELDEVRGHAQRWL
ncbi:hypothetical protein INR49_018993 [Caranx melampygus]|nr:hypothetical protein INR49_018993 [Caranx melampygus]